MIMQNVLDAFALEGAPISCERYGNGHINETYLVKTDARAYILQKINGKVFLDIPALMQNIASVTRHLAMQDPDPRHVLTLVPTRAGADFYRDPSGYCYRVYHFVTGSLCLETAESAGDLYQSGVGFGLFQRMLSDFPAHTLHETIPRFHDTANRFALLRDAVSKDAMGRALRVKQEIDFAFAREAEVSRLPSMPLRVTHNDTKLNNVLLDQETKAPLCVIDLDTVMPGLVIHDFGDSIRFGASTAAEDERDLSLVSLSLPLYAAYAEGFLGACGDSLTPEEVEALPMGAKLMTLECGVRFLTDYLAGDTYFRIHREGHNLDRCRTQFKLVLDMEAKWDDMGALVHGLR